MKGIELPINILVIVAVAIIVLLGVIALFYSSWFGSTEPLGLESAKTQACNIVSRQGCDATTSTIPVNYDVNRDGTINLADDNLQTLCETQFLTTAGDTRACLAQVCGMAC